MDDNTTLSSLNVNPQDFVHIEVQSVDPINLPLKLKDSTGVPLKKADPYQMPEVLTVTIQSGNFYKPFKIGSRQFLYTVKNSIALLHYVAGVPESG